MVRALIALVVIVLAGLAGWIVYKVTNSQLAAYIVGVAGVAIGLAALVISLLRQRKEVKSKIKVGEAKKTKLTGIQYSGRDPMPDVESDMEIDKIEGGEATGVEWKKTND